MATAVLVLAAILAAYLVAAPAAGPASGAVTRRLAGIARPAAPGSGGEVGRLDLLRRDRVSSISPFRRLLLRVALTRRLERLLARAHSSLSVGTLLLWMASQGGAAALLLSFLGAGVIPAFLLGALAGAVPLFIIHVRGERRAAAFTRQFPEALDILVSSLRAGFALPGAIGMVAEEAPDPIGTEFEIAFKEQNLGVDLREALENLTERVNCMDLRLFVIAVLIQRETGGNLAEVLEKISTVVRERFRIMGDAKTLTSEGRLSGIIMGIMQLVMGGAFSLLNPGYMSVFVTTPTGKCLLVGAIVLQVIGFLAIRKISDVRV